jgi:hypothetical protein
MGIEHVWAEIERMRVQVGRLRSLGESKLTWHLSASSPALVGTQSKLWFAARQKNPAIAVGRVQAILTS